MKAKFVFLTTLATTTLLMASPEGKALYDSKCASCHGLNAEKAALGKSKILTSMNSEEIVHALKGYQDGSYGGQLKKLKKGLLSHLSEEEIGNVASYIKSLAGK